MKALIVILAAWLFPVLSSFAGGMPVIDAVAIANQRIAAQRDYIEQVLQGLEQAELQPDEVFRPLASRIGPKLEKEIVLDGKVEATRDGEIYAPEVAERRTQEDYQQVRATVMTRRDELRQAMAANLNQLQHAGTASEVQKLSVVVAGLAAELQATDHELQFAAGDVQARAFANATE
ncbi:MAG: hypothetical protein CFE26_22310, partial [Verrucomicrobiales bacterium VVV1]